jgi:RNA polymerase sigma-70 factor (ECF subfamily)
VTESLFNELYKATNEQIYRYVSRRISWDVDDVVDDIYTTAWRRKADLPANQDEALLWLYAVGRRVIANKVRWKARSDRFNKLNTPLVSAGIASQSLRDNWVHDALVDLPNNHREALMLVEWDGLSVTDAAEVIGVPETTLTKRLSAARAKFAQTYSLIEAREK